MGSFEAAHVIKPHDKRIGDVHVEYASVGAINHLVIEVGNGVGRQRAFLDDEQAHDLLHALQRGVAYIEAINEAMKR